MISKFATQVLKTIQKHQMLGSGGRVLAAVSGGADSVCLAAVLVELGFEIAIAHVNHGLRGAASDQDESFTSELAHAIGLPFFSKKVVLVGNIEAAGRDARKEFFDELANTHGFDRIAVAHTQNDRVETFLANLLRGAGTEGMVSMAPVSGRTIRPLIEVSRDGVETYLRERGQAWRNDASNSDLAFVRNRLRHVVLPGLASEFNPKLLPTLARTIEILDNENAWMQSLADEWLLRNSASEANALLIHVEPLQSAPVALVRRVLRNAMRHLGSKLQDVTFDQIEHIRMLLGPGKSGKVIEIPGAIKVSREFNRLVFSAAELPARNFEYELKIPGQTHIPETGTTFTAEIADRIEVGQSGSTGGRRVFVDAESIGPYVKIRNWKPGDYYRPIGLPAGKLKKLFQRARIPRSHRSSWPVVVAESTIIWVASFPVSREFAPRGRSQKIVALEALQIR